MDQKIIDQVAELTKSNIAGKDVQAVLDELGRLELLIITYKILVLSFGRKAGLNADKIKEVFKKLDSN